MRIPVVCAIGVILALVLACVHTAGRTTVCGRIDSTQRYQAPSLQCLLGHDEQGRCMVDNLAGGVETFLAPGALASLVTGVGGILGGLGLGYFGSAPRILSGVSLGLIESLPRLVILLLVYSLWDHSMMALGVALGILLVPALAQQVRVRLRALEAQDYFLNLRAHGLPESRILFYHMIWLTCGGEVLRQMLAAFGNMVILETTLSYVRHGSLASSDCSWGYLLQRSLLSVTELLAVAQHRLRGSPAPGGNPLAFLQMLSVMGAFFSVFWAVSYLGRRVILGYENEEKP